MILLQRAESLSGLPPKQDEFVEANLIVKTWYFCKVVMAFTGKWNQRCNRHRSHSNTEIEPRDSTLRADRLTEKCLTVHPEAPTHNSHATCLILPGLRWVFEFEVSVPQKSNELSIRSANTTNTSVCILHVSSIQSINRETINERRSIIHPSYEVRQREDH